MMRLKYIVSVMVIAIAVVCGWGVTGAQAQDHSVAVIIGNKNYHHGDIPEVRFAHNDAQAFRRYLVDSLGYKTEDVIIEQDAPTQVL
jgi:hypothetical protein